MRNREILEAVVREPAAHFVLLAGILFLAGRFFGAQAPESRIEIDRGELTARIQLIEESTGAELTPDERERVESDFIDEQILVREALARGLEDDPRIDDFLAQKMLHVLSADVIQPRESELEAYFEQNRASYLPSSTARLEEIVIGTDDDVLPPALLAQLEAGRPGSELETDLPLRSNVLSEVTEDDLISIFGAETAARAFGSDAGAWTGPHVTVRGQHWLRLIERSDPVVPSLDEVRAQVRLEWIAEQEEARLRERVAELRERYEVSFTGPAGS